MLFFSVVFRNRRFQHLTKGGVLCVSFCVNEYGEYYYIIKKYRDKYKLCLLIFDPRADKLKRGDFQTYDEKLKASLFRSRQKIFEYAYCNDWEYFVTMTLDKEKFDRYNLPKWHKSVTRWLYDYRRKTGQKIDFLLIPEQHKDGAWHIHGLLKGLPLDRLSEFPKGTPLYGSKNLNWKDYAKKYGFCSVSAVENSEAVSKYITKYITKDMAALNRELGAHLYYVSRGLNAAETMDAGYIQSSYVDISPDFENEYVSVKWSDSYSDLCRIHYVDERKPLSLKDLEELEL